MHKRLLAQSLIPILSILLLLVMPISGLAAEIQVPSQFATIQAAIDASQDGDTIVVQPGTYTENIDYKGKAITLTSTNPLDLTIVASTIIDGNMNGSVVIFDSEETPNSVLTGFTIRNGSGTLLADGKRYGGGIYIGLQSIPTIRRNKIINNTADIGGAIYIHGNSLPAITDGPNVDYPYVRTGQTRALSVTATDPDGDQLVYRWVPREGGTITGTGSSVSFSVATAGVYHIDLTVDDQHGGTVKGMVSVTVIGVAIQTPVPQLIVGNSATIRATVTPSIAHSPQYPVSITWSLTGGPATGTFDAAVNGTPQATSITFTPSASGPGQIQAVYQVGAATATHSVAIALNPIALSIDLGSGKQGETIQATITGNNLGRVNAVSLSGSGVTGSIRDGKTENTLPVQFVINKEAAAGNRTIILSTPEGQFNTPVTFQINALPPITANPTSLNLTVSDTGNITFSIPDPAPTGGLSLTLSSSAPAIATVAASATIPEGQKSVQVSITAVAYGTTTITADAPIYSKAQVPVTITNPPLITFSPSPLTVPVAATVQCTVSISNPAPTGGLVVTLVGGTGKIEIPATITIPGSQKSAAINVKGLAEGTVTVTATATGYPAASLQVNVAPLAPINCGQTLSASISAAGEKDSYYFIASAGDIVTIRARDITGSPFTVYIELYGPTGALVGTASSTSLAQLDKTLTAAGTYTVVVRDSSNHYTGNYTLTWQKLNGPCGATPLNCGQVVVGSISVAGQLNPYTLTVADNDVVTIMVGKTSGSMNPRLELYGSAGNLIASANYAITRTFTTGGRYTVLVRDDSSINTGGYAITWNKLVNPCNATGISCGQDLGGAIGASVNTPPWNFYTFTASAGDVVTIRASKTSGSLYPYLELYGPTGTLVGSIYSSPLAELDKTLTAAGTYTVVVSDVNYANTGNYTLTWQRLNGPCGASPLNCGQVVVGSISVAGQLNPYTLTVADNDVVTIMVGKTSGSMNPRLELYGSAGNLIASANYAITRTFTTGGTYTVLVRDDSSINTGGYAITWNKLVNPCNAIAISCGQTVSGAIGASVNTPPWNFYTFTASANDMITIRARVTSGSLYPYLELYGPTGTLVGSIYSSPLAELDKTLTAAGTYTVVVSDVNYANTGNYTLTWQRLNGFCGAAPLSCGQVVVGSISVAGQLNPYTLTVADNDVVTIMVGKTSGSMNPRLELYGSAGNLIASANYAITRTFTTGGTYTVLVRDDSSINTGGYAITWNKLVNPCNAIAISCGQTVSGAIGASVNTPPWNFYTFTASAGDVVTIRASKTSGSLYPYLELYGPTGTLVGSIYSSPLAELDKTLTAAGTYTVVMSDVNYANTGNYTLTWQKPGCP